MVPSPELTASLSSLNGDFLDDSTYCYAVGRSLVLMDVASNRQTFLTLPEGIDGVAKLAVSAARKTVAVAGTGYRPSVAIIAITGSVSVGNV